MLFQLFQRKAPGGLVVRVDLIPKAEIVHRGAEGITAVVELQDIARVFFVPQQIPRADILLVHHRGVIDDTDHTVQIGNGIIAVPVTVQVRIVIRVLKSVQNVADRGNVAVIQLGKQVLVNEALDHIVRGDDHVIVDRAGGDLGVHRLVAGIRRVVYLYALAGFLEIPLLEHFVYVKRALRAVGDILAPVVNVQRGDIACACLFCTTAKRNGKREGEQRQGKKKR